jgi:hypothetical protein
MILFSLINYEKLINEILKCGLIFAPIRSLAKEGPKINHLYLKHDVECNVDNALLMAKIEKKYNIFSTYYFHDHLIFNNLNKINDIANLGHEIGYHHDCMDSNEGNFNLALSNFKSSVKKMRSLGLDISTCCPHGNPTKLRINWVSNKDLFRLYKSNYIDDVWDLSESLTLENYEFKISYISDYGYDFVLINNFSNSDKISSNENLKFCNYNNTFNYISSCSNPIILSLHPHRYKNNNINAFISKAIFLIAKFLYKILNKVYFFKFIFNKLFKFSKFL